MKKLLLVLVLVLSIHFSFSQAIEQRFLGNWNQTIWTFDFKSDHTYQRSSKGHFGFADYEGNYQMSGDTISLITGSEKITDVEIPKFLLTKDSFLVDLQLFYDYKMITKKNEHYFSKKRNDILMPYLIIFVGNSITEGCNWAELFSNPRIINRGVGGDTTKGVLTRLPEILNSKPSKIFLNIGTNDLGMNMRLEHIIQNYEAILDLIQTSSPTTKVYVQSVLPTNNHPERNNDSIIALNSQIKELTEIKSIKYINLYDSYLDTNGNLKIEFTYDGLHLKREGGYEIWKTLIEKDVNE
jgi:lysophospholipase L1-like esterase